ncbi:She4p TDEL_0A04930 [Torulaspora delbrueckii]|uniref:UNC-45/Cro1/She4 central domain-containing protein n=1 Tax=Torulaspora delbrueckii TaxID=4950 RepID=G8ZMI1_TORDE|nr:hypothetical protein TDEL_0A04930 [Torulaspora delbrueckii]CCE89825.1 hypothetical protein TDEL_0A04930 [Torulaspora delbrueckii]
MNQESASNSAVDKLCTRFTQELKTVDAKEYDEALNEILGPKSKNGTGGRSTEQVEEVLTRSFQDHFESRKLLKTLVASDVTQALDVFEKLSLKTVALLVDCFSNTEDTFNLLKELQYRIHMGEDIHIEYLLNTVLQLLHKFNYNFAQVGFLVQDLCQRVNEPEVKSLMLLIFSVLDKKFHARFNDRLLKLMDSLLYESEAGAGNDPLSEIVGILTELYPVLTNLCSEILLGKRLKMEVKEKVVAQDDDDFTISLLKLFSIACIDEIVRSHIAENYMSLLERSLKVRQFRMYSALVLIKTWSFTKLQSVDVNTLAEYLIEGFNYSDIKDDEGMNICVEGLAYLSLKTSVKVSLRNNVVSCEKLAGLALSNNFNSTFYGVLVILANLSVSPKQSKGKSAFESKSLKDLQSYADLKNPNSSEEDKTVEKEEDVLAFNEKYLLQNDLLSHLNSVIASLSHGSKQQLMRIIYNICCNRDCIQECIKQGSVTAVLQYMAKKEPTKDLIRVLASRSLTKLLIHTNPNIIFKKYSPVNAIAPLFELLPRLPTAADECAFEEDVVTVHDSYNALLALTNLASLNNSQGEDVCRRIVTHEEYWYVVENLMLDENKMLQRSTLELLSNLMGHPRPIAVKFFNFDNPRSEKNFEILVKLLELEDLESQRAVAAIFANISTSIPFVAQELLKRTDLLTKAVDVLHNQISDVELSERLILLFHALTDVIPDDHPEMGSFLMGNTKLIKSLEQASQMPDIGPHFAELIPITLERCQR